MVRKPSQPRKPSTPATAAPGTDRQVIRGNFSTRREKSLSPLVLLVERDRLLRWALYEILSDAGFRVLTAPGETCVQALLHQIDQEVSLALVDDDSWPLTPSARATLHERWPDLPIVVMSHSDDPTRDAARARTHGAIELLVKPFDLPDVVRLAERLTGTGRPVHHPPETGPTLAS